MSKRFDRQMDAARRARRETRVQEAMLLSAGCARAIEDALRPALPIRIAREKLLELNDFERWQKEATPERIRESFDKGSE